MNELISQKIQLRKNLTHQRDLIKKNSIIEFNDNVFNKLQSFIDFKKIENVASFISIRSEISTDDLNKKILELNKTLLLPVIKKNLDELVFKKYNLDSKFKIGKFNIPEPESDSEELIPQLFFVPCLGFDLNGFRLGYGGGFYDKTFAKLKNLNLKFYAIGYAFDKQKQVKIPTESFDFKLDFVLTEKQLYKFI